MYEYLIPSIFLSHYALVGKSIGIKSS